MVKLNTATIDVAESNILLKPFLDQIPSITAAVFDEKLEMQKRHSVHLKGLTPSKGNNTTIVQNELPIVKILPAVGPRKRVQTQKAKKD